MTTYERSASIRLEQAGQQAHDRCLAGAVRAKDDGRLPIDQRKTNLADRLDFAEASAQAIRFYSGSAIGVSHL
jgi:hypothetical protein